VINQEVYGTIVAGDCRIQHAVLSVQEGKNRIVTFSPKVKKNDFLAAGGAAHGWPQYVP
jgi:hypothetical protein